MGDCRIRISVARSLFASYPTDKLAADGADGSSSASISHSDKAVVFSTTYSADTTVREVAEGNPLLKHLFFGGDAPSLSPSPGDPPTVGFCLWDFTLHPPRDITSWPRKEYPDLQGPRSKTLHAAGWFPSGTWVAVPRGTEPGGLSGSSTDAYADAQYNTPVAGTTGPILGGRVEFLDPNLRSGGGGTRGAPLPSRVVETVANRFAVEERGEAPGVAAPRKIPRQDRLQKERERGAKLERRIAVLEEQSKAGKQNKKKKTSDQVLRMLVKSRATGDKNLKQQDRLYCQCLVIVDGENAGNDNDNDVDNENPTGTSAAENSGSSKEYRYFSPQDTFAKIANSFQNPSEKKNLFGEVLCRRPAANAKDPQTQSLIHRRFPVTMRVYEAIREGYLSLSKSNANYLDDMLIVRWYKDREDATLDLQHDNETIASEDENDVVATTKSESVATEPVTVPMDVEEETTSSPDGADADATTTLEDALLTDAIQKMEVLNNKGKKKTASTKKASAAALKVRQMKMKSKSKGNKKLNIDERFFLEVVSIPKAGGDPVSECCFLSKKDPIERVLQYIATISGTSDEWRFLVPREGSRYQAISEVSMPVQEAEEKGIVKSFDRLILCPRPQTNQN